MYEEQFGFSAKPFQLAPDAKFYYPSAKHSRALAFLEYGLDQGDGFIVVTGDVGTGKTTVLQTLLNKIDTRRLLVQTIVTTQLKEDDLLQLVASSFGLKVADQSKAMILQELERLFVQQRRRNRRVLIIVDEAQNLPPASVEELRMLSNFHLDGQPLLQVFLVGQQEFRETLLGEGFEQLRQRVIATYHLEPLDLNEVQTYIEHRLKQVGWKGIPQFGTGAFAAIYEFTGGVPRRINNLCDRLLLFAYLEDLNSIDAKAVESVAEEIGAEFLAGAPERMLKSGDLVANAVPEPIAAGPRSDLSDVLQRVAALEGALEALQAALAAQPEQTSLQLDQIRDVLDDMLEELKAQNSGSR
jgi:putative secretion ATPase (PEP-CTERM system associated)